jgi:hypothetical protein
MYDEKAIPPLMLKLRQAAKAPLVISVTEHFAGYFDELGITIEVHSTASDEQISALRRQVYAIMSQTNIPFKWIVMFRQGKKSVGELFPNDAFGGGGGEQLTNGDSLSKRYYRSRHSHERVDAKPSKCCSGPYRAPLVQRPHLGDAGPSSDLGSFARDTSPGENPQNKTPPRGSASGRP